jgi:hypothetical protein
MLNILGFYLIIMLMYDYANAHQIVIIASILLTYFLIEQYAKYQHRKVKNRRENGQQT